MNTKYNVIVPNIKGLTGIILSSYGFSEPLKQLNKLNGIFDHHELRKTPEKFQNFYNIMVGLPPWKGISDELISSFISCFVVESTELAPEQENYLKMCKEVWVPTSFCQKVLQNYNISSKILPYCIETPKRKRITEKGEHFTFLMSFDGKYSYVRKGVLEGIQAFKLAFPKNNTVKLKLKTFDLKKETRSVLVAEIAGDDRIFIDDTKHEDFEKIYDDVSCFVSPHKGEGFGRHLAESMYRHLLVIASKYGGPEDFCNEDNSILIKQGTTVEHKTQCSQYNFSGKWFTPDINCIAEAMIKAFEMSALKKFILCYNARKVIKNNYSQNAIENLLQKNIS